MKRLVAVAALVTVCASGPAGPATAAPSDGSSCVAKFVNAIPAGARGQVISFGAQDPTLHPFGGNIVSDQAQRHGGPDDPCLVFSTP